VEVVPIHTDDELVAKVMREQAIERGEIVEKEDDKCEKEEEPEMTTREITSSITKLQKALLAQGDFCSCTAKMRLHERRCGTPGRQHWRGGLVVICLCRSHV
jgi:hypothetical protein